MNNKKKRIFDIIQIGYVGDVASRTFDIAITAAIIINLFIAIFDTFEQSSVPAVLDVIEWITVIGFTIEYILRVWTAEYLYPNKCQVLRE
ncbi:MAG: ion transporter [Lachnospira eligens]